MTYRKGGWVSLSSSDKFGVEMPEDFVIGFGGGTWIDGTGRGCSITNYGSMVLCGYNLIYLDNNQFRVQGDVCEIFVEIEDESGVEIPKQVIYHKENKHSVMFGLIDGTEIEQGLDDVVYLVWTP